MTPGDRQRGRRRVRGHLVSGVQALGSAGAFTAPLHHAGRCVVLKPVADLRVSSARGEEIVSESRDWPSHDLSSRQLCDLELLLNGGFSSAEWIHDLE